MKKIKQIWNGFSRQDQLTIIGALTAINGGIATIIEVVIVKKA